MRRGALQLARRLPGSSGGATTAAAACSSIGCLTGDLPTLAAAGAGAGGSGGGGMRAAAAELAPWRPFSAAASVGAEAAAEPAAACAPKSTRDNTSTSTARNAVDSSSPLGKLRACQTVGEMQAWRDELAAEGQFGTSELAAAIRAVGQQAELPLRQRQEYLRELLTAGVNGSIQLDPKTAAYLLWGPVKCGLAAEDPDVQRCLPAAFQHMGAMRCNDLTTCLWALGVLGITPDKSVMEQLTSRLVELLPTMKLKELIAAGVGATRLNLPDMVAQPLVHALEAKLAVQHTLGPEELARLVKLLPYLPGVHAERQLAQTVFGRVVRRAPHLKLGTLSESMWTAGRLQYQFNDRDLQRLLRSIQSKLPQNNGMHVQSVLRGLATLGHHASDEGPLGHEFLRRCAESQLEATCRYGSSTENTARHLAKMLVELGKLQARLPEPLLQRTLEALQESGLKHVQAHRVQAAFRRLEFQPGVDTLEPLAQSQELSSTAAGQRKRQPKRQQRQQPLGAAADAAGAV